MFSSSSSDSEEKSVHDDKERYCGSCSELMDSYESLSKEAAQCNYCNAYLCASMPCAIKIQGKILCVYCVPFHCVLIKKY